MTDQQIEKHAFIKDSLSDEQWAELDLVTDILNRAKKHKRKTIKGAEHQIAYYTDDDEKKMRFILWPCCRTTAPADKPLKECLPVGQYEN